MMRTSVRAALAAALLCVTLFSSSAAVAAEEEVLPLNAALLTRDLGDPRRPGNVKLVVGLPEALARMTAQARPEDFQVYVHPVDLSREEGLAERYRADGLYLWRHRNRIFLDARGVPAQDDEGEAAVHVVYAPGGEPLAEGVAEGNLRYTSEFVDVVLAVDVSRSMLYNDPQKRRVTAARAFIDMARQGGGIGRVGLVTFNHRANSVTPLLPLEDGEQLIAALDTVGADGLTNLDGPLRNALDMLGGSRKPVIILLSDGKNEGTRYRDTHLEVAARGVRIFSVGLSEEADHDLLKEMADATGGIYFRAVRDSDLPEIYARLAAELGKRQLLRAEALPAAYGEKTYPVDATVTRLVALADGGAQVAAIGGGGMFTTGMSGVLMGKPNPGEWTFAWSNATPDVSTLALFGETQFFLDVFPPQMLGDRLSVGATLAERDNPLAGGSVWIEPLPGVLPARMELFDDGRHGDGRADDGVYAGNAVVPDAPQRFDLTIRAEGEAWDAGDFVRQTAGLAIKAPAPPPDATVSLNSDIDFGVLFPGETGVAEATIELTAPQARDLSLDLSWDSADADWPDFASQLPVEPGRRAFELEITIPETARPGSYTGSFRVGDGGDIDEESRARVTVGTVDFTAPGAIDLGVVPPGTFVSRAIDIPYRADKPAGLAITVDNNDNGDVAATSTANMLATGRGSVPLEIVVSAPMDRAEGGYAATVRIAAGPGVVEIPLTWQVRQYAAAVPALAPVAGLPAAPDLPARTAPLAKPSGLNDELWRNNPSGIDGAAPAAIASPWENTERLLHRPGALPGGDGSGLAGGPAVGDAAFTFPETPESAGGGASFWSAWWLYILAALLLLLLLLLLIAYLLYRLGKSALARFLLASALANALLMVIFIMLLSVGASPPAARAAPIAVMLVEEELPVEVTLSPAEESLLGGSSAGAGSAGAGASMSAMADEASMADALAAGSAGGQLVEAKEARLPGNEAAEAELADARQPSAMPLDPNKDRRLRRDDRLPDRNDRTADMPAPELAEMTEPPAASEAAGATAADNNAMAAEFSEARLEIEADALSDRPVWSTGERPVRSLASDEGLLLAEAAGMEKITRDPTVRRMEPRGSRRNPDAMATAYPEPRVEIDDPARDSTETAAMAGANADMGDPGVEEVRVALRAMGADELGEKPGALLTPGASRLADSPPDRVARGLADATGVPELSRPVGGPRSARGAAGEESDTQPGVARTAPGARAADSGATGSSGSASAANAGASNSANSSNRSGGANGTGSAAGEQRFDDAPSSAASGGDGVPGGTGGARTPATAAGGGSGASPSPLASGGGGSSPADYVPANGAGGGAQGGPQRNNGNGSSNNRPGGRTGRSDAGSPAGSDSVPGSGGGSPGSVQNGAGSSNNSNTGASAGGGDDSSSGSGRGRRGGGTGEGRFDDLGGSGDGQNNAGRRGVVVAGGGSADLASTGGGDGPGIVSYDSGDSEWQRIDRRPRERTLAVAASAVGMDSLLIIVGDFARLPDAAAENLFSRFARFSGQGLTVEERLLSPEDDNLSDTLLALATPEQVASWSDADLQNVAAYLEQGGHIWIDAATRAQARTAMERLAAATDGDFAPLPAAHQLAENADVDALGIGDKLAAIATCRDWRKDWRFAADSDERVGDGALRFFVRTVNYFLSGDADSGIVLEPGAPAGGTLVQPYREIIPDSLAAINTQPAEKTTVWDEFGPETAASWRMPAWSDPGRISAISDGQGARALKLDLDAAAPGAAAHKGRAAAYRTLQPAQDFSGASAVTFEAYYDGGGDASLSMVFTVNEDGAWHDYETLQVRLDTGWNSLRFNLDGADFRSLTPGGTADGTLPAARARTGRAGFFLYRSGNSAAIALIRDLRLVLR